MKDNAARPREIDEDSVWPCRSLFLFGYFGPDSPAGKKLRLRTTVALLVLIAAAIALPFLPSILQVVFALVLPGVVIAIGWSYVDYLRELDELRRKLQLEAMALAYGATMVLATAWFAFTAAGLIRVSTWWGLAWIVIAEPLRGMALVYLARR